VSSRASGPTDQLKEAPGRGQHMRQRAATWRAEVERRNGEALHQAEARKGGGHAPPCRGWSEAGQVGEKDAEARSENVLLPGL